jgi:hypothetical protein
MNKHRHGGRIHPVEEPVRVVEVKHLHYVCFSVPVMRLDIR